MQFKWKIRKAAMGKNFPPNECSKMLFDELRARMLLPIMAGLQGKERMENNGKLLKVFLIALNFNFSLAQLLLLATD